MSARNAQETIKERLIDFAADAWNMPRSRIRFEKGQVIIGNENISFADLACRAHRARIQLSCAGFYATPKIEWDRAAVRGRPFFYFAYGAACSEVTIDTMTGEMRVDRVD